MLLRLLATLVLAVGAAGIVILVNRALFQGRLPKWVMPVVIGATIIGFQIVEEYSWYPRIQKQIEGDYVVMQERSPKQAWRPWSFIYPSVTNVTVVNKTRMQAMEDYPQYNLAMVTSLSYLGANSDYPFLFDCVEDRFGPYNKDVSKVEWAELDPALNLEICNYND